MNKILETQKMTKIPPKSKKNNQNTPRRNLKITKIPPNLKK